MLQLIPRWTLTLALLAALGAHGEEPAPAPPDAPAEPAADAPSANKANKVEQLFEKFEGPFRIQGIAELPFYSFYIGGPAINGVAYLPSFGPRLGPRVLWKDIGITFTFALPIPEVEQRRRGTSDQTGVILNSYWRQDAMDLYYQRYRGFYVTSPGREFSAHKPERYPQLPDAQVTNAGFNWYYVFAPDSFSLKAAFDQSEFQLHSGGSWMANPFYNHLEMSLGGVFLPGVGDDSITAIPKLAGGHFDSVGCAVGYGYTYIHGRYFGSVLGGAGPGLQVQNINNSETGTSSNLNVALKLNFNAAAGWNSHDYVLGLKILVDSLYSRIVGTDMASNLWSGQAFFGARF